MSILTSAENRYATKAFDPTLKLSEQHIDILKEILRLSPSSINLQPWHFIIATSQSAKDSIADACQGAQAYNAKKIKDAAMMVVLCAKTQVTETDVNRMIEQEHADGRYNNETLKQERFDMVNGYVNRLNESPLAAKNWIDKQCYIALGNALLAAADMGIDSVPIEGFDANVVNENFGLAEKGLHAVVLAGFGYRSDDDFNAKLNKSRLSHEELFTEC